MSSKRHNEKNKKILRVLTTSRDVDFNTVDGGCSTVSIVCKNTINM